MIQRLENDTVFVEIEGDDPSPRPDQKILDFVGVVNYCFKVSQWVINTCTLPYLPQEIQVVIGERVKWWPSYQTPGGTSRIRTIRIKQREGDNRVLEDVIALLRDNEIVFSEGMLDTEGAKLYIDPNSNIRAIVFLP